MKKLTLLLLAISFSTITNAQLDSNTNAQNAIKINASSLLLGHVSLQYERIIGKHFTACLGLRMRPNFNLGNINSFDNQSNASDVVFADVRYSSIAITPEVRYYFKEAMRGFYIAPYFRVRRTPFEIGFEYRDASNMLRTDIFDGNINSFSGGLMIGTNVYLNRNFSLDIFIVGGHYGTNTFALNWNASQPLTPSEQSEFIQRFQDFENEFPSIKLGYNVNSQGFNMDTQFGAVGFRGAGFNFVYKF